MSIDASGQDRFSVRLPPNVSRVLKALQSLRQPRGARPIPKGQIVERALLALAEAEGIDVGEV